MMVTTKLPKILDLWWFRILLLCSFTMLLFYSLLNFGNTFIIDNFNLIIVIGFLAISAFIELNRENSRWYFFGLFNVFKKEHSKNHILLSMTTLANMLVIFSISLLFSKDTIYDPPSFIFLISIIFSFLLIAFLEELFFRGIIFQAIEDRFGSSFSAILTSVAFASIHLFNPNFSLIGFINTFLAGILLSIIFIQTRSIILSSLFHFYWNFFLAVFIGSPVSGLEGKNYMFLFNINSMPVILSGGLYGFEGGIIVTLILIINIYILSKNLFLSPFISSKLLIRDFSSIAIAHKMPITSSH